MIFGREKRSREEEKTGEADFGAQFDVSPVLAIKKGAG
jgi:hypothetical protein